MGGFAFYRLVQTQHSPFTSKDISSFSRITKACLGISFPLLDHWDTIAFMIKELSPTYLTPSHIKHHGDIGISLWKLCSSWHLSSCSITISFPPEKTPGNRDHVTYITPSHSIPIDERDIRLRTNPQFSTSVPMSSTINQSHALLIMRIQRTDLLPQRPKEVNHRQAPFSQPPVHQTKVAIELVLQSTVTFFRTPDHGWG